MLTLETIREAPKALLHDHLDGGLRPQTIVDLAAEFGYDGLPTTDPGRARRVDPPRRRPQVPRAVPRDVRPHRRRPPGARRDHPRRRGVRRGPRGRRRRLRRGPLRPGALDRARPDPRRGRRREPRGVPDRHGAGRRGRQPDRHEGPRHRDAPGRPVGRGRRVRRPLARRRASSGSTSPAPRSGYPPTRYLDAFDYVRHENFHITIHAGESFGLPSIWEALQFCGAERLGHGVRIVDDIDVRTTARSSSAGWRRSSATGGCRSRCARRRTSTPAPPRRSRSTRSTCSAGSASGSR